MGVVVAASGGGGGGQFPRKGVIENLEGLVGPDISNPKFKRRKVSAVRDFPIGCGRLPSTPTIHVNPGENVVGVDSSVAGTDFAKESGSLGQTRMVDAGRLGPQVAVRENVSESESAGDGVKSTTPLGSLVEPGRMVDSGGLAPSVDMCTGNVDGDEATGAGVGSDTHLPSFVETIIVEGINSEQIGLPDLVKTSSSCGTNSMKGSDQANVFAAEKKGDSASEKSPKAMDVDSSNRGVEPEGVEFTESSTAATLGSSLDFSQLQNKDDTPSGSVSLRQNSGPLLEDPDRRLQKKYPPRKRISAHRDFPQGCGRDAPPINHEECPKFDSPSAERKSGNETFSKEMELATKIDSKEMKALPLSRSKDAFNINSEGDVSSQVKLDKELKKDMARDSHVRETSEGVFGQKDTEALCSLSYENLAQSDLVSPSFIKKVDKVVRTSAEKKKLSKATDLKRKCSKMSKDSNSLNQFQKEDPTDFETFNDRVIVQALMAAPNCPLRQGKGSSKSPSGASIPTAGSKPRPQLVVVQEHKGKTVSSKGKTTKKNMCLTGEAAIDGAEERVFKDDQVSSGNAEEGENASSVPISEGRELSLISFALRTSNDGDVAATRNKVRETLRLFQTLCRKFLRDEEAKPKDQTGGGKRVDILASNILRNENKYLNREKMLGPVPGVEVGDEFHYRAELAVIGLHHVLVAGIDYLKKGSKLLATSVVASGGYENDTDRPDVLIYVGQGGNSTGDKKAEDQKLEKGNLSLKNSMDAKTPVRVIRGYKEPKAPDSVDGKVKSVTTYTYDGLFMVDKFWTEQSRQGNNIFKFELRRVPGQPELALREVKNSNKLRARKGLCVADISQGKEKMPISAFNTIDDSKPPPFEYVTRMIYPSWYNLVPPKGCDCVSGCSDSAKCYCVVKNGGGLPFNHNGAIVEAKPLVHECGPSCKCPPSCPNRVSQHGIMFQLEIFRTDLRGWGVRSIDSIPSGSFICEYTGELLQDKEAEQRADGDEYLFDIGHNYNDQALWGGLSTLIPPTLQSGSSETVEDVGFTIDAALYGSIGRFINHSCSPNLYAQNVLYDHDDKRMPHIMLFAAENIPPLQELTYHYNYQIDQVHDSDGNIKKKSCYCGSPECTGRMY
ncbi:hypothetical protein Scep_026568 [Stephania cephalantha]|uniref:Uncharacterized protein n=1 Tax=Stephania cephalantha TaxID=152367 RepID=A0AAP0HQJ4_9MAGN